MKLYPDYRKLYNLFIFFLLFFSGAFFASGQNTLELQNRISQKNADIARLEDEIRGFQREIDALSRQKTTLAGEIKALDLTRKKLNADISVSQNKIDKTSLKIKSLSRDIDIKEDSISINREALALGIRQTDELESGSILESMLSHEDFSLIWADLDNMMSVREKIRSHVANLLEVKDELEDTRAETIDAKKELEALRSKLADQKKIIEQNTAQKNKLLAQTKNSESSYQKVLKDRVAQVEALEKELREYESALEYILDPKKLPPHGSLSWPLDNVYITQLFGKTVAAKRLYASGSHSGVDFRAPVGTPVKAMASGVVAGVGDTDTQCYRASFGKYVFIKYDNGLASAFGHLSLIKASPGDRVARGTVVGYTGNTGHSTGPHLHVTVYAPNAAEIRTIPSKSCPGKFLVQPSAAINAYLDPMDFLPPYNR